VQLHENGLFLPPHLLLSLRLSLDLLESDLSSGDLRQDGFLVFFVEGVAARADALQEFREILNASLFLFGRRLESPLPFLDLTTDLCSHLREVIHLFQGDVEKEPL
jgi:hypothetical protein